jgi:putative ABC transport system ATP-binding protein
MQLFLELHRGGRTIVMITHDPTVAAIAARKIVLKDGRIDHDSGAPALPVAAAQEGACSAN